ncbi:hypothetical protein FHG08_10460 [Pseudoalteromonas sp. Scap03]|uniref:hypothetical protein n=1 Tax=unclassified Pseudoalteromonas TaxID=194690 RepID=UPI0015BE8179|nr:MULTISPECIES: hypothetical protein [unclassified Pseudoalteromonas]NWL16113.1 hypothetical protein [Pseudoalteromonas sp. Scap03]QLE81243.1 hypothetical protein FLM54_06715 [Pseudoalteromonas sp. Scap25]QLE89187.1 hypothetical protein FLM47_06710 [Pseudoalteromonas sp. Scap06]
MLSFSSSAIENVIFNKYYFPINDSWETMRVLEKDEGFALVNSQMQTLSIRKFDNNDSLITLEDGSTIPLVDIHLDSLTNSNSDIESKVYKEIKNSFSRVKEIQNKTNSLTLFVEVKPDLIYTQIAYLYSKENGIFIGITSTIPERDFLKFLKSIHEKNKEVKCQILSSN